MARKKGKKAEVFSPLDLEELEKTSRSLERTWDAHDGVAKVGKATFPLWKILAKLRAEELAREDLARVLEGLLPRLVPFLGSEVPLSRLASAVRDWPAPWAKKLLDALAKTPDPDISDKLLTNHRFEFRARVARLATARAALMLVRGAAGEDPRAVATIAALLDGESWPDDAWAERARKVVASIGASAFDSLAAGLLALEVQGDGAAATTLAERTIWTAGLLAKSKETLRSLAETAERDSRRGDSHAPLAQAVVRALALAPPELALPELDRLAVRVKHKVVLQAIKKAQELHAARAGTTREELLERAVPTFELDASGARVFPDGSRLAIDASGLVLLDAAGAEGPSSGKKGKQTAVSSERKRLARGVEETLSVQRALLEQAMVDERSWPPATWKESVAAHPILGHLARRVLWIVRSTGGKPISAFLSGDRIEDLHGEPIQLEGRTLSLAHPIHLSTAELERARETLVARAIVQPWKQLFRETYAQAPHEELAMRCERFRGQVVPHSKLYALAKGRGWSGFACTYDTTYEGKRTFSQGFRAHIDVGEATGSSWEDRDRQIRLGDLCFEQRDGRSWAQVSLGGVPRVVFSEACRDLDLVVGVASVGEDSAWLEWDAARRRGEGPAWPEALGRYERILAASAATRAALLARILPALGLAGRVTVEGRFARVQGELGSYRVHLGSANVHKEPQGRFVAFPRPAREIAPRVYLPDDAALDPRTAEVVARVLLLAGDALVTDPALAAQLAEA
ncbi:DUF4132 domain-containing protein [bacterium]|nr:DUF4132 domain-containing protein [bacterium]